MHNLKNELERISKEAEKKLSIKQKQLNELQNLQRALASNKNEYEACELLLKLKKDLPADLSELATNKLEFALDSTGRQEAAGKLLIKLCCELGLTCRLMTDQKDPHDWGPLVRRQWIEISMPSKWWLVTNQGN